MTGGAGETVSVPVSVGIPIPVAVSHNRGRWSGETAVLTRFFTMLVF